MASTAASFLSSKQTYYYCKVKKNQILGGSRPPWVGLGASVWVQIASGNTFTFPLYSHSLKPVLGFNQSQFTLLGVANDIGENVGLLPGIACNTFPPWLILSVGAFASFLGYGILWLAVSQTVTNLPYLLVSVCGSAAYVSQLAWIQSGTIEENILFGSIKDKAKAIVTLLDQSVGSCLVLAFGYTLLQDPFSWRNIMGILLAMVGMIHYIFLLL
ncbi:unnamed protein product [Vicia faba]|uniref:Nodulin-like domain-containing protein n=1 Tax=Vicia faba TaxID=3906 RepID=A0AAV0YBQ6_VICFA|nr:unnamed protein product [Vicia faba]